MATIGPFSRRAFVATTAVAAVGVAATGVASAATAPAAARTGRPRRPLVIGHRGGGCGYRPEHTLASYEFGARNGADYIEPDLVSTKDGVLVCRHEPEIGGTTNVADHPEFADRKTTKKLDGVDTTGWFTEDFTLAELKTLRAKERIPDIRQRNTIYNGRWEVPTFQEVIDLRARLSKELGREIGIYPETKHPTYFKAAGLDTNPKLVAALNKNGLNTDDAPVFVQSFELHNLKELADKVKVPLIFLTSATGQPYDYVAAGSKTTYADLLKPDSLKKLSAFLDGIGPDKTQVIPWNDDKTLGKPTSLVSDAHAAGLKLHPYTFRAENNFLPADYRSDSDLTHFGRVIDEIQKYLDAGIDGFFTDFADIGRIAVDER